MTDDQAYGSFDSSRPGGEPRSSEGRSAEVQRLYRDRDRGQLERDRWRGRGRDKEGETGNGHPAQQLGVALCTVVSPLTHVSQYMRYD